MNDDGACRVVRRVDYLSYSPPCSRRPLARPAGDGRRVQGGLYCFLIDFSAPARGHGSRASPERSARASVNVHDNGFRAASFRWRFSKPERVVCRENRRRTVVTVVGGGGARAPRAICVLATARGDFSNSTPEEHAIPVEIVFVDIARVKRSKRRTVLGGPFELASCCPASQRLSPRDRVIIHAREWRRFSEINYE